MHTRGSSGSGKVFIAPVFDASYYSFYVDGIFRTFPRASVQFSARRCPAFGPRKLSFLVDSNPPVRFLIDAYDRPEVDEEGLEWCDIYGKVNYLESSLPPPYSRKVIRIGPSFPVRMWGLWGTALRAWSNYFMARTAPAEAREHFALYWRQYKYRLPEQSFRPGRADGHYVFSSNSIWKGDPETNRLRALFFECCRSVDELEFEGGFTPRVRNDVPGFERYYARRYDLSEYLANSRRSAVVFNTPACDDCHGFKLAEYLALGKAIISTPLKRELPAPLVHGENVHFVEASSEGIREGLSRLLRDREYRSKLETGARSYYCEYLRPRRVIERLLAASRATRELAKPTLR